MLSFSSAIAGSILLSLHKYMNWFWVIFVLPFVYFSGFFIGQIAADVVNVNDSFALCNTLRKIIWGVLFFGW
jgi:hypothetical protein